jgi:hypothetical protein
MFVFVDKKADLGQFSLPQFPARFRSLYSFGATAMRITSRPAWRKDDE